MIHARNRNRHDINGRDAHLRDDLADLTEVRTAAHVTPREEVLDEARADIVAHLLELLVHLRVVLVVLDELHDERAVREGEQLCILLLGASAGGLARRGCCRLTIFSVRPFQRSSPTALYCLLVVAIVSRRSRSGCDERSRPKR